MNFETASSVSIVVAFLSLTFLLVAQQVQVAPPKSGPSDSPIISKLQELVALREQLFLVYQSQLDAGLASRTDPAEVELAEARIELAKERRQPAAVVAELKNLVSVHKRRVKSLQAVAHDRVSQTEVEKERAALLQAEIRLLRSK